MLLLSRLNSQSKVTRCFSLGFLCSFLYPLRLTKERSGRQILPTALLCPFFLNDYPSRPDFGVCGESPIHLLIGQGAVNVSTHYQSAILNDFLPCVLPTFGNYLKHSLENVLRPYSINLLLHILKTQPLIICVLSAPHWVTYGG